MSNLPERGELLEKFGHERVLSRIVGGFLDSAPNHLKGIEQSIQENDALEVSKRAHSYKGSIGYFSQGRLYDLVKKVETLAQDEQLDEVAGVLPELKEKSLELTSHLARLIGRGS